ncbi:MAG: DUF2007 domain-containing protein [Bacteroidales bacterium]|nr:DUF2007 domain-containing protein [Bacteroidales bacterium]
MNENNNELVSLVKVNDKAIAEEIQHVLQETGIYSILKSDHPASSALSMYVGNNVFETISVYVTKDNSFRASQILENTPYYQLFIEE